MTPIALMTRNSLYGILIIIALSNNILNAQGKNDTINYKNDKFIKTNPYKPFLGIVNIGFEVQINKRLSLSIFGEYLIKDKLIVGENIEHPVVVVEMAPRYYFSNNEILSGFFIGTITGFTLKRKNTNEAQGIILGMESGYKFLIDKKKRFFIEPKLLFLYNFSGTEKILPGIEGHIGIRF
ncbi:MAG: DUF3575 domain-containing protein [Acidobacteria bacterium]|nr:DUF3575 domain-containing protein [Acidobacteriota bacterium]